MQQFETLSAKDVQWFVNGRNSSTNHMAWINLSVYGHLAISNMSFPKDVEYAFTCDFWW